MIIDRTNYYNKRIVVGTGNGTIYIFLYRNDYYKFTV